MTALPPQRWIGWGYESDPEVWTPEVMAGETQYWLGDTLLVGGVYEAGKNTARMYLPSKGSDDEGYFNLNSNTYIPAGKWQDIASNWQDSIPLLARIGGAIVVGKNIQTRSSGDHRFPSTNVVEDDYRAVEIFPPPPNRNSRVYSYTWYEDDGIAAKPEISKFTLEYSCTSTDILVRLRKGRDNKYVPLWKELDIILPAGEGRTLVSEALMKTCVRKGDSRCRAVWTLPAA